MVVDKIIVLYSDIQPVIEEQVEEEKEEKDEIPPQED